MNRKRAFSLRECLSSIAIARSVLDRYRYLVFQYRLNKLSNDERNPSIIIGASGISSTGWITTEQSWHDITSRKSWLLYFSSGKVHRILAEHFLEHLNQLEAIQNFYEFLEPGCYVRLAVPDGNHSSPEYIENVRPGGIGPGALDHKVLYIFATPNIYFTSHGFIVNGLEYFNESGDFIAEPWKKEDGMIHRSLLSDERNTGGVNNNSSIILNAFKPRYRT